MEGGFRLFPDGGSRVHNFKVADVRKRDQLHILTGLLFLVSVTPAEFVGNGIVGSSVDQNLFSGNTALCGRGFTVMFRNIGGRTAYCAWPAGVAQFITFCSA